MGKESEVFFEVKVNTKGYDVLTGSKGFYQFLGNRLYVKFDMIIPSEDRVYFREKLANCAVGDGFEIPIVNVDNQVENAIVFVADRDENGIVTLQFESIKELYQDIAEFKELVRDSNMFLSQFNCIYYIYNRVHNCVMCFRFAPAPTVVATVSADEWRARAIEILGGTQRSEFERFVTDLVNGIRSFRYKMSGNIFAKEALGDELEVCGNAIYEDGVHIKTVGSINGSSGKVIQDLIRRDQLTGLILKEDINNLAKRRIEDKKQTAIAIIDIDDFKFVNDNFGHMKGDEVLKKCAAIIEKSVAGIGSAGRIGGDEFFIVVDYNSREEMRTVLRSLKNSVGSAYSEEIDGFKVTTSIGCAVYPLNLDNYTDLFMLADVLLYRAKNKGKNRYVMYNAEKHGPIEELLKQNTDELGIGSRKGLEKSEVICAIADTVLSGRLNSVKDILNDVINYFDVERISVYSKTNNKLVYQCGDKLLPGEVTTKTIDYIHDSQFESFYEKGIIIANDIKVFENDAPNAYNKLKNQGVFSLMHHLIKNSKGEEFIVSYEAVLFKNMWNQEDMHFYRILDHILAKCL